MDTQGLAAAGQSAASQNSSKSAKGAGGAAEEFLAYMKMSPAERMEDAWLRAHGLTKDDLKALPPEKRQAIMKQMADDIKREIEQKVGIKGSNKATSAANLVAAQEAGQS